MNLFFNRLAFVACFATWSLLFLSTPARAKPAKLAIASVFVDADEYNSHADQTADLVGHVKVIRGTEQMTCDKAHIDLAKNEILAEGNVVFITPTNFVRAERMNYNFQTKKGIIQNGFMQSGHETIEGEEIIKTGEDQYQAKNATYTSCVNCPASWKFSGSNIDATVGDYAYVSNAVVKIYGAPVLWLPYAIVPIKTQRQSGLLPPSFGSGSTDGFTIGDSYFWNINKSKDVTLTETSYANRGFKTGVEYRFVADQNSKGKFLGNFINDAAYAQDSRFTLPDCRYTSQGCLLNPIPRQSAPIPRFGLHYEHHYELPDNYVNNINLNLVRDSNYILDFPQEMTGQGDSALENRFSLAKNTENTHTSADIDIYENLLKADPVGQNADAVHRVPELKYFLMPTKIWGVRASLEANYVNFFRAGSTYDEANGIAGFQPTISSTPGGYTDRFRTGQRAIIKPDLTYPFNVGEYLDVLPELTYEEDYYQFGYGSPAFGAVPPISPTASRRTVRTTLAARSKLSSVFTLGDDPKTNKFKHEFIPEVKYTYVPYLYQDFHAFFLGNLVNNNTFSGTYVPQAFDGQPVTEFDNFQFDYRDRLRDLNLITFGITNVLIQKHADGDKSNYNQLIRHRLTQSYDFYTAQQPLITPTGTQLVKQPWSEIHSLLEAKFSFFNINSDVSYYGYDNVAAETTSVGVHNTKGDALSLGYSETYSARIDPTSGLVVDQVDFSTHAQAVNLSVFFTTKFLDISSGVGYDLIYNNFTTYLVNGLVKFPGKCWGFAFTLQQTLGGSGSYSWSLPFFFGDSPVSLPRPPGV
jgi:LPS-assembly protein